MSLPTSMQGFSKRPKRATRACDHCRWKRLKCSDEQKDKSCMNCVIYGTPCQYTTPLSPGASKRKDSTSRSGKPKKSQLGDKVRSSASPGVLGSQRSPSSGLSDDGIIPRVSDFSRKSSELDNEHLGSQLDQYAAFLTSFGEGKDFPSEILSSRTGLPPQPIANALLQAYVQGFQAGSLATQAKLRPKLQTESVSSSPLDFDGLNMNGSPVTSALTEGSASTGTPESLGYNQHIPFELGFLGHEHGMPMRHVPEVQTLHSNGSQQSHTPNHSRGTYDWSALAENWNSNLRHGSQAAGMPPPRYDNKFPFIFEDGFDRRRREA